jgi:dUTP pyrophosphatase
MGAPLPVEVRVLDERLGREFPMPQYASAAAAGLDLLACVAAPVVIAPGQTHLTGSGIAVCIGDANYVGLVAPRSGLGVKHGIVLANTVGVIDADYQGELMLPLFNRGNAAYTLQPGERVCQLLVVPVRHAEFRVVEEFSQTTARGGGGFGSTGKR